MYPGGPRLMTAVGLLILASACGGGSARRDNQATATGSAPFGRGSSLDLTEVAYRYLFNHNASAQKESASFYCLAQGEPYGPSYSAAPEGMTQRLSDVRPPVVSYPACGIAADSNVIATARPGIGIIFYISSIDCETTANCEVTAGYYEGNMSASEQVLRLKKNGVRWNVVGEERGSIA